MKLNKTIRQKFAEWTGRAALFLVLAGGVTVLILWLAGKFVPKISTHNEPVLVNQHKPSDAVVKVRSVRRPMVETAVGTIRPVQETTIGARLLASVVEVNLNAGKVVKAGDVLVRLDDTDLKARRRKADAVLNAAEAVRAQAELDVNRSDTLLKFKAVSRQENEQALTALKSADAELRRAKESINEIQATLEWAAIRSPISGIVIDKKVDVGDTVTPGQMLATLFDPKRMQLVANVREALALRLKVGQSIEVQVENFNKQCSGTISEIVPEAESSSRAFQVKVTGPCPEGVYSGMFGRILIPLDEEQVLVIPRQAVQSIGQLDLVNVAIRGAVSRRAIRLGRTFGNDVEVLSGLREGEEIHMPLNMVAKSEAIHD
jgi:membrane fusion protein (multidrug efflux system)